MEITKTHKDTITIFSIVGDVSIFYKDAIDKALAEEVDAGKYLFLFDFSQVNYIDSVGISFLIQAGNASFVHGKRVAIVNANPKVRYVIELAKLERILALCDSMDEGLAELQ